MPPLILYFYFLFQRNKSNETILTIERVQPSLSGTYNCEVSAEQSFHTALVAGFMEVVGERKYRTEKKESPVPSLFNLSNDSGLLMYHPGPVNLKTGKEKGRGKQ